MEILEIITEAIGTITVNKMRTGLAVLGIVIGISSVIALISLGQGSQKSIENQIQSLGSNLITVSPGSQNSGGVRQAAGSNTTLTLEDALAIQKSPSIDTIQSVSPELNRRSQITAGKNNTNTSVIGVYPQYFDIRKITLDSGVGITQRDIDSMAKVAVIGPQVATDLFGADVSPLGKSIRLSGQSFLVVGQTVSKGGNGFNNLDDAIFVPLTTAQKQIFGVNYVTSIVLEAKSKEQMVAAQDQVGYLLLDRPNSRVQLLQIL